MWLWLEHFRARGEGLDLRCALAWQRAAEMPGAMTLLRLASHVGDGPGWIALTLALMLRGSAHDQYVALVMSALMLVNLLLYFVLKRGTSRPRPFVRCADIRPCMRAMDQFSFPSGHTLHAVSYALLLASHYPAFSMPLWSFAALVAASRVVLGMHYPSDVLAGALIGACTAALAVALGG